MLSFIRRATFMPDLEEGGVWRVESETEDGAVSVAVFSGPNAHSHASAFARHVYGMDVVDGLDDL